jgi:hypothetical protein
MDDPPESLQRQNVAVLVGEELFSWREIIGSLNNDVASDIVT